jgi:hypothetical protein
MSPDSLVRDRANVEMTTATEDFSARGWTVAQTANGLILVCDDVVAGIELRGKLAADVRRYLRANNLTGPVVDIAGPERREIHLVTGLPKAALALAALPGLGAITHTDGAGVPLPPTKLVNVGAARWSVAPHEARWLPPVVALASAVRAVRRRAAGAAKSA